MKGNFWNSGSFRFGFSFGLVSGILTTLGLMVGLNASTGSAVAVIGGVIIIAVADSLSDSLSIHISKESEVRSDSKAWKISLFTFLSKMFFSSLFVVPLLLFSLNLAVLVSVGLGLFLLGVLSYFLALEQRENPLKVIFQHWVLAFVVIISTHFLGLWIKLLF
ncbi:hypothetical protein KO361_00110 [Candidatus Woesearchaeota archaeon]|nr:hypothetical protein [Candidatus Woesearchaeota archaeon]